jgi:uncharacterized protein (DUF433 family)
MEGMEIITEEFGGQPYRYLPLGKHIVRAEGVCGERPTFKYTHIEVAGTLNRLAAGEHIEDIVTGYAGRVSKEAIQEAITMTQGHYYTKNTRQPQEIPDFP